MVVMGGHSMEDDSIEALEARTAERKKAEMQAALQSSMQSSHGDVRPVVVLQQENLNEVHVQVK